MVTPGTAFPVARPIRNPRVRGPHRLLRSVILGLHLVGLGCHLPAAEELRLSVYATAGDILQHLATDATRRQARERLRPLPVTRLFLEGRRGDEYVPPALSREVRAWFEGEGIDCAGGIATVPGATFGVRQQGGLGWLDWEAPQTRADVASFFTANAPVFDTLIVDDFYCTGDESPAADRARQGRSWAAYRQDLLVSLLDPLILRPAREANPDIQLILKFPQWYDRFHLFGYDPLRMAAPFDALWVGTEVRNPATRRMGYVPPAEGYINFQWLRAVAGPKVRGAWFDHIECTPQNFVDQAFQSVLAGARELTLFRLGDILENHPGDAALAARWTELRDLASRIGDAERSGVGYYKPPGSDAEENLYLMEYLVHLGLPILPRAAYPEDDPVVFLAAPAAADPQVLDRVRAHLQRGATLVMTPEFIRRTGPAAARLAGVRVTPAARPAEATQATIDGRPLDLDVPLQFDAGVTALRPRSVRLTLEAGGTAHPWLISRRQGTGRVVLLNVRTFAEQDFRDAGEWLLAPRPRGLTTLPPRLADALRRRLLPPLGVAFRAPAGVALYLWKEQACVYNFRDAPIQARLNGRSLDLPPHGWTWVERRRDRGN